ncbi:MAG TPA: SOS response-associated peptidase [Thermomicrobiales bacterium]|nr:SOS response-associated peptidase [Thermomicrobiales bacterium]
MCGRFVQQYAPEIPDRFGATPTPAAQQLVLTPRYNVAPTQAVAAVLEPAAGERVVDALRWGLEPRRGGGKAMTIFNARAETLLERPMFRRLLPSRRCLVPADGFFEWERVGGTKVPWLYRVADGAPFAFAGLYDRWTGPDGAEVVACTVLTTAPNELVAPVHNRMPVILPREVEAEWLDPGLTDPRSLLPILQSFPAARMERYAVSTAVNSSRVDDPALIRPVAA